jgi:hypothetical protein
MVIRTCFPNAALENLVYNALPITVQGEFSPSTVTTWQVTFTSDGNVELTAWSHEDEN